MMRINTHSSKYVFTRSNPLCQDSTFESLLQLDCYVQRKVNVKKINQLM